MKSVIYIIGNGGHARVIARSAVLLGAAPIFISPPNDKNTAEESIPESVFFSSPPAGSSWGLICGVGSTSSMLARKHILTKYENFANQFVSVTHPTAIIDKTATISVGSFIGAGAVVANNATIGRHVIVNTSSIIEHDVTLGDNSHVASGATILGGVVIGDNVHVGASATVLQGVRIGSNVVIGASSLCIRNIPEASGTWIGIPAKKMGG
jgi:sugar O-acyltransferase (sialic acid O-acetyltransferase NeuD family)